MNKTISVIAITLGVALCAAFGARLPEQTTQRQVTIQRAINQAVAKATLEAEAQTTGKTKEEKDQIINEAKAKAQTKAEDQAKREHPAETPTKRLSAWWSLAGLPFSAGCVLIIAGALIARREEQASHSEAHEEGGGPVDLGELLAQIHSELTQLSTRCDSLKDPRSDEGKALRDALQAIARGDLERVVEARGKVKARFGVARFAELYGSISQAERRMNRAWSALVDGHVPEAHTSLKGALESLDEARERLRSFG